MFLDKNKQKEPVYVSIKDSIFVLGYDSSNSDDEVSIGSY